jgi:hypothetical protein
MPSFLCIGGQPVLLPSRRIVDDVGGDALIFPGITDDPIMESGLPYYGTGRLTVFVYAFGGRRFESGHE